MLDDKKMIYRKIRNNGDDDYIFSDDITLHCIKINIFFLLNIKTGLDINLFYIKVRIKIKSINAI